MSATEPLPTRQTDNTGRSDGGVSGSITKTGGTIYGYTQGDPNSNRVTADNGRGHAVSSGSNRRESTAEQEDNLDSRVNGIAGGWH